MKKLLIAAAMLCMTSFVHATNVVNVLSADNSTFENNNLGNWNSWGNSSERSVAQPGYESNYCLKLVNPSTGAEYYSAQAALSVTLENGKTYYMKFMAKAENASTVQIVYQNNSTYKGGGYVEVQLTNDWNEYEVRLDVTQDEMNQLLINFGKYADTYYFDNIEFGEEDLNTPVAVTGIDLVSAVEIGKGKNTTLVPTFTPSNATNKNVTWQSDKTGVATVDGNGVVTGVSEGTANITVTTEDGSFRATCAVTVETLSWTAVANGSAIKYAWDEDTKTIYLRGEGEMPSFSGTYGFAYKDNLDNVENIVIGEGITTIGEHAFDGCKVSNVTFPSTLTAIGDQALKQTSNLSSCDLSNTKIINFNCDAFKWAGGKTVQFPPTLQSITGSGDFSNSTYKFHSIPAFAAALNNPASVSIVLDDAVKPFIAASTDNMPEIAQAEYKRNVTAAYSTICLPFAVSELGGVKVYEMTDNASPSTITLNKVQSIQAGIPYVVATADIDFTVNNPSSIVVNPSTSRVGSMELVGVMRKRTLTESNNAYGLSGGKLYYNTGNMTMNPMRAYFLTTSSAPAREMSFSFGEATAISNVAAESDIVAVYGANGARQARLTKGVNLVKTANGNIMKVIVK